MKLEGKKALITGGSTGIGRETVYLFAKEGADIVFTYLDNQEEAEQMCSEIKEKYGHGAMAVYTDVSSEDQVKELVKQTLEELGKIDILVISAGILQRIPFDQLTTKDWQRMIDINLNGTFYCIHEVLPLMLEKGYGRIITVSSQLGQKGGPEVGHYAAAKGAIIALTKSLARAYSTKGININSVAPGPIMTSMTTDLFADTIESDKKLLPLGRQGEAFEVAPSILFLASSPEGDIFVGQTLGPNSGDVML
ncbi:3-oxoacyl-ACP reductase family protein [Lachnospiraceae bacterium 62-35]